MRKTKGESRMVDFKLYLISSKTQCAPLPLESAVAEACAAGVRAVQLREKNLPGRELYEEARALRCVTAQAGARLFINDRADIALAADADGIHCPENGLPIGTARALYRKGLIGVSVHSLERAVDARMRGADFVLFGPVFATPSKMHYGRPQGLDALAAVARDAGIPVFAVGGITEDRVSHCMERGAAGVAVISAIMSAGSITKAVKEFEKSLGGL
ncbi:MAG: thiamine phosphate synthase [Candidatus Latescibacterota bacterium]